MKTPVIEFKDFSFRYKSQTEDTLHDINLTIYEGEKVLLLGSSGSGKTTLGNCINGLIPFSFPGEIKGSCKICGKTPEDILTDLLGDFGLEILDKVPTRFYCDCNRERVSRAIISIGKKEIQDMMDEGKPIEASCQFCNKIYTFTVEELGEMLRKAGRP